MTQICEICGWFFHRHVPCAPESSHQRERPMDRHHNDSAHEPTPDRDIPRTDTERTTDDATTDNAEANPPHTTTGKITSPKFGSAGSGGLEYEPGPPRP
jgi:hypothetical protein